MGEIYRETIIKNCTCCIFRSSDHYGTTQICNNPLTKEEDKYNTVEIGVIPGKCPLNSADLEITHVYKTKQQ
jgi:hypothetical protein